MCQVYAGARDCTTRKRHRSDPNTRGFELSISRGVKRERPSFGLPARSAGGELQRELKQVCKAPYMNTSNVHRTTDALLALMSPKHYTLNIYYSTFTSTATQMSNNCGNERWKNHHRENKYPLELFLYENSSCGVNYIEKYLKCSIIIVSLDELALL